MAMNEEGKGFGCACVSHDPFRCAAIRYSGYARLHSIGNPEDDECECVCHTWEPADDDNYGDDWD